MMKVTLSFGYVLHLELSFTCFGVCVPVSNRRILMLTEVRYHFGLDFRHVVVKTYYCYNVGTLCTKV